jgi:hypothetical protein
MMKLSSSAKRIHKVWPHGRRNAKGEEHSLKQWVI